MIDTPEALHSLGADLMGRILPRIRRGNFSEECIQEVACDELQALDCDLAFDPQLWLRFIKSTNVPQKKHWFSDVPVILAHNRNLQIQLLVWTEGTTAIHSHAFCGAFRVLQGASVHTRYRFDPQEKVSESLQVGRLVGLGSELLIQGSIRQISSGGEGLVHALFHLDSPSLTMVVRTHPTTSSMPQFTYYRPGLALDKFSMAHDEEVVHMIRLLQLEAARGPDAFEALLFEAFISLDAPRLVYLCLQYSRIWGSEKCRERLRAFLIEHHSEPFAQQMDEMLKILGIQTQIKELRRTVECSELRYFLALLLNVPNRATLLEMVALRFPERDPITACAQWLLDLSELRVGAQAFMQEAAARSQAAGYRLGSRIANRLPRDDKLLALQEWLSLRAEPAEHESAYNPLMDLAELSPLFIRD